MTTCTYCPAPATTTGPLGEPDLCCACACEDDSTDEWKAEDYARRLRLSLYQVHYIEVDNQVYEMAYNEGRWTAVDLLDAPEGCEVVICKAGVTK